jgi:YesN/AraC family two-component response regulator
VDRRIDVLIADDQVKTRRGLKALLRFTPFIGMIWEAQDGEAAMRVVSEVKPEVVIMDIRMPVMDGIEATRRIKHTWPEVKVIILTMYPHYEREALAAGADCYLVKGDITYSIPDAIQSLFTTEKSNSEPQQDLQGGSQDARESRTKSPKN